MGAIERFVQPPWSERAVSYGRSTRLAGILTIPANPDPTIPAFVLLNSGILHMAGPSRMNVLVARRMAEEGAYVLRFDLAGLGDSPPRGDGLSLTESVVTDIRESLDFLQETIGRQRFTLFGLCSGADNGLRVAAMDQRVVGLAMLDPTIHRTKRWYWEHYRRRILDSRAWMGLLAFRHPALRRLAYGASVRTASEKPEMFEVGLSDPGEIERYLNSLVERDVALYFGFTGSWSFIYNYHNQLFDCYEALRRERSCVTVEYFSSATHTFPKPEHMEMLLGTLSDWAGGIRA